MKPIVNGQKRKAKLEEKPCPVCFGLMKPAANPTGWACAKHGEPRKP